MILHIDIEKRMEEKRSEKRKQIIKQLNEKYKKLTIYTAIIFLA